MCVHWAGGASTYRFAPRHSFRLLYRKLLAFYPNGFKEQLVESMEQTFNVSIILLPIALGRRTGNHDMANAIPTQRNTLLTNPGSAAMISVIVFLSPGILPLLDSVGWLSLDRLFNGLNPEVDYLPGMFLSLGFLLFPVAAGITAGGPIIRTLWAGGSLFAHPINLIIVVFIASTFAIGLANLIIDQWPCFIGVPNCD